ncbi:MAG: acetylxylan esterase [Terrimicrobiaceae bacterium]|nr:acetylxylan esterase [Terrimicrobiaceae bacterium]
MPQIDKPLAELELYHGINPRPSDYDAYWDRALAELDATDPQVELIPNPALQTACAEAFDLFFTGVGGARVYAKYLRPKNAPSPHPAVLQFHGYTGNSGEWCEKLAYVSQGFSIASLDCRGQGGRSEDNSQVKGNTHHGHFIRGLADAPEKLLFRQIFLDAAQLARIVMGFPEIDPARVGAFGASQGGALTIACAALEPRIRRAAPVYPFLADYLRVWQMDLAKDAYQELRTHLRAFDPLHAREEEIFIRLGYIDIQFLASRINAEVLFTTGLMDTICPPSTQFAVYNKLACPKRMLLYPDFGHEGLPGNSDAIFNFLSGL